MLLCIVYAILFVDTVNMKALVFVAFTQHCIHCHNFLNI